MWLYRGGGKTLYQGRGGQWKIQWITNRGGIQTIGKTYSNGEGLRSLYFESQRHCAVRRWHKNRQSRLVYRRLPTAFPRWKRGLPTLSLSEIQREMELYSLGSDPCWVLWKGRSWKTWMRPLRASERWTKLEWSGWKGERRWEAAEWWGLEFVGGDFNSAPAFLIYTLGLLNLSDGDSKCWIDWENNEWGLQAMSSMFRPMCTPRWYYSFQNLVRNVSVD